MASVMPFTGTNYRRADPWCFVGLASSFPNVELDGSSLVENRACSSGSSGGGGTAGCRVFHIPRPAGPAGKGGAEEDIEEIEPEDAGSPAHLRSMKDQVLVFRYKGKFHAVDNVRPRILLLPRYFKSPSSIAFPVFTTYAPPAPRIIRSPLSSDQKRSPNPEKNTNPKLTKKKTSGARTPRTRSRTARPSTSRTSASC